MFHTNCSPGVPISPVASSDWLVCSEANYELFHFVTFGASCVKRALK